MVLENVVLLHGFAGTGRTFDGVLRELPPERYTATAPDLPGHGSAAALREITFESCVRHVLEGAGERFILCGYSMGGRIALHVALAAPSRVSRLVIVSASAGIDGAEDRERRLVADERLAVELESEPLARFIERWRAQQLFADEPVEVRALAVADHRRNRPRALAAALRGVGTGAMEPLWDRLSDLEMPTRVLAGERDSKYVGQGRRMVAELPCGELSIVAGGHSLALERPDAVAAAIRDEPVPVDPV